MNGFTLVDGIVLVVVVLSAILAYSRGFMREMLAIAGWVIAAICGFFFAPAVEPLVREIPVLKDIIGTTCELSMLAAFAAVFAVALVIVSIFTPLLSGAVQNSALGPVDQGLGFLFGVARGVLLVVIALVVYDTVMGGEGGIAQIDNSRSRVILSSIEQKVAAALPENGPEWVGEQFSQLTQSCN